MKQLLQLVLFVTANIGFTQTVEVIYNESREVFDNKSFDVIHRLQLTEGFSVSHATSGSFFARMASRFSLSHSPNKNAFNVGINESILINTSEVLEPIQFEDHIKVRGEYFGDYTTVGSWIQDGTQLEFILDSGFDYLIGERITVTVPYYLRNSNLDKYLESQTWQFTIESAPAFKYPTPQYSNKQIITSGSSSYPIDFNRDGAVDILAIENSDIVLYTNDGFGQFSSSQIHSIGFTPANIQKVFDVDNNGSFDVILSSGPDTYLLLNDEGIFSQNIIFSSSISTISDLVDLDFDGYYEFINFNNSNNNVYHYEIIDGPSLELVSSHGMFVWPSPSSSVIKQGDLDNDGDLDFLMALGGTDMNLHPLLNDYSDLESHSPSYSVNSFDIGDYDGFNDLEILYRIDGDTYVENTLAGSNISPILADFNGDGYPEFLSSESLVSDMSIQSLNDFWTFDVDGDGDLDIYQNNFWLENDSNETDILNFTIPDGTTTINQLTKEIMVELPANVDITNLTPTFSLSNGAQTTVNSVSQTSGISSNDFTNPIIYEVLAHDGFTSSDWIVSTQFSTFGIASSTPSINEPNVLPSSSIVVVFEDSFDLQSLQNNSEVIGDLSGVYAGVWTNTGANEATFVSSVGNFKVGEKISVRLNNGILHASGLRYFTPRSIDFFIQTGAAESSSIYFDSKQLISSFEMDHFISAYCDADNNLDLILVSTDDTEVILVENDGSGGFNQYQMVSIAENVQVKDLRVFDIDSDGQMEIFLLNGINNEILRFDFNGSTFSSVNYLSGFSDDLFNLIDIDGDGDIDIFSIDANYHYWYENDGSYSKSLLGSRTSRDDIKFFDGFGDGIIDVQFTGTSEVVLPSDHIFEDNTLVYSYHPENGGFGIGIEGSREYSNMQVWGNYLDPITFYARSTSAFGGSINATFSVHLGSGSDLSDILMFNYTQNLFVNSLSYRAVDLDGNGINEILYSFENQNKVAYIGMDEFSQWDETIVESTSIDSPGLISSQDVDNDGDMDLLVTALDNGVRKLYWYENTVNPSARMDSEIDVLANETQTESVIHPNPADEFFTLLDESLEKSSLAIFNLEGKEIYRMDNLTGKSIEVPTADIPSGLVVVKLIKPNETKEFKLVIQH